MKKFLICFILMIMGAGVANAAELDAYVDYDNSVLNVSYATEVNYGPMVSVLLYKPSQSITKSEDFVNLPNPAEVYSLGSMTQIKKAAEARADFNGNMQISFDMENGFENGYYIVSASQSGSVDAKCSSVIYFETKSSAAVTISNINLANRTELDALIKQRPLFFGSCKDYAKYNSSVLELLMSVKAKDFGGRFQNASEVRTAFCAAVSINDINSTPGLAQQIIEGIAEKMEIEVNDANYVADKISAMKVFSNIVSNDKCDSIEELKRSFRGSVGVALVNRSNQADVDNIIREYGDAIGISYEDYIEKCSLYTATNIDKIFVGASFKTPSEMVKAYTYRVSVLASQEPSPPSPSGNGGGGGGGVTVKPQVNNSVVEEFKDLSKNHWAYPSIMKMKSQNILSGYEDNTFKPDRSVTREEFVRIAVSALGYYDSSAQCIFDDVGTEKWSYHYVASAVQRGLIYGITENEFGAGMSITREDAAVIMYRALKGNLAYAEPQFADSEEISDYAKESIGALCANGIVKGVNEYYFAPKQSLTRAQTAVLIENVINYINSL